MKKLRGLIFHGKLTERLSLRKKHLYFFLGLLIVLLAIFLRTHHLSSLPPGIYPDEAVNGTDAIRANESGHYRLFYPNNYGREGLFINLIAWGFLFFGVSVLTLKMWAVFFGVLTIVGIMLLARELFGTWRAGLIAGFLYTTSFWALNFSRISFRANMLPFVLVFSFYFLWRCLRTGKNSDAALAGLFLGIGAHTYIAFRAAPLILPPLFLALLLSRKDFWKKYWRPMVVYLAVALIIASPILIDFILHPQFFETRSVSVSVFSPVVNKGNPLKALTTSISLTLKMFTVRGDQNWRHNLPRYPELEFWAGIFFLIGISWSLVRFIYNLFLRIFRKKYHEELALDTLLLAWFLALLIPEILAYEGLPHSLRAIGVLPVVYLFAVFSIEKIFQIVRKIPIEFLQIPLYFGVIAIIAWSGYVSVKRYFVDWAQSVEIHGAFSQNLKNIAIYLNNLPSNTNKYVVANAGGQIMDDGFPVATHVIELLTHYPTPGIVYLLPNFDAAAIKPHAKIMMMYYNGEVVAKIKDRFPSASVQKLDPQPGNGTDSFIININ